MTSHAWWDLADTVLSKRLIFVRGATMGEESAAVLTADEAAKYLRVSLKTLYRLVAAGKVPGQKVGRSWRFRKADLVAFLQARP
jgi:excisionase family DNA binding protein